MGLVSPIHQFKQQNTYDNKYPNVSNTISLTSAGVISSIPISFKVKSPLTSTPFMVGKFSN